jgi:hypothetical protein
MKTKFIPTEIYCSWSEWGSPAQTYGLSDGVFIKEINSIPVNTLDDLMNELHRVQQAEEAQSAAGALRKPAFVRLKTMSFDRGVESVIAIRPDNHYWPSWSIAVPNVELDLASPINSGHALIVQEDSTPQHST